MRKEQRWQSVIWKFGNTTESARIHLYLYISTYIWIILATMKPKHFLTRNM